MMNPVNVKIDFNENVMQMISALVQSYGRITEGIGY